MFWSDIDWLVWILVIAILADGVKTFIEIAGSRFRQVEKPLDHDRVTVIITARNESERIVRTIHSARYYFRNILLADDGSTDRTAEIVKAADPAVRVLSLSHNGKVAAQHRALAEVTTPYVLFMDADVTFGNDFQCPELGDNAACAFNVVPQGDTFIIDLQRLEYSEGMMIGRRFQSRTGSVPCVSGAAGLFRTDRLRKLATFHSGVYPGDDLERTLIELSSGGKVIFSDHSVHTVAPMDLSALARQRVFRWAPGLWRNLPFFMALLVKPNMPTRLKVEMFYQLVAAITDPLRIISLLSLIFFGKWATLITLYGIYFLMKSMAMALIKNRTLIYRRIATSFCAPIYASFQLFLRVAALPVYLWNRFRGWRPVRINIPAISLLLLIPSIGWGQDFIFNPRYEAFKDSGDRERSESGAGCYLGYKDFYADFSAVGDDYRRADIGLQLSDKDSKATLTPAFRYIEGGETIKVFQITAEKSLGGPFAGRVSYQFLKGEYDEVFLPKFGLDYYLSDRSFASFNLYEGYGNGEKMTEVQAKLRMDVRDFKTSLPFKTDLGLTSNNDGGWGRFAVCWAGPLFASYSFNHRNENYDYDRRYWQVGLFWQF